jgi:hypothetical protein
METASYATALLREAAAPRWESKIPRDCYSAIKPSLFALKCNPMASILHLPAFRNTL